MKPSHIIALLAGAVLVLSVTLAYLVGYERGSRKPVRRLPVEQAGVAAGNHRIDRGAPPPTGGSRFSTPPTAPSALDGGAQSGTSASRDVSIRQHTTGVEAPPNLLPVPAVLVATDGKPGFRFTSSPGTNGLVRVQGTSTVGDWQVESRVIGGYIEVGQPFPTDWGKARPGKVAVRAEVFIPVRSLKSVRDGKPHSLDMDNLVYRSLGEATHRHIKYSLMELALTEAAKGDAPPRFDSLGILTVAGVSREIGMPVELFVDADSWTLRGLAAFKMSDFGIDPPTPTPGGGPVETGDDVKVSIQWNVSRRAR